jgi:hypothetical protein
MRTDLAVKPEEDITIPLSVSPDVPLVHTISDL